MRLHVDVSVLVALPLSCSAWSFHWGSLIPSPYHGLHQPQPSRRIMSLQMTSEEDSTMGAYEKAMQMIAASTPQQPARETSNAMSAYENALRQMATQNNSQVITYSRDENAGFVEAAFNDATFSAQERKGLQTAGTWTNYPTAPPPVIPNDEDTNTVGNAYNAGWGNSVPFQSPNTVTEDPPYQQQQGPEIYYTPQGAGLSQEQQQQQQQPPEPAAEYVPSPGFLQALKANSGTRQGILTAPPIVVTQIPSETESSDGEGDEWMPPLMFVTKDDSSVQLAAPESQSLYSEEPDLDPPNMQQQSDPLLVPSPEYQALASMYRTQLEETTQGMPQQNAYFDPSADVQAAPAQQSTQGPEAVQLQQPSTENDPFRSTAEPESQTSPSNFVTINPQLNSFMSTAWEESENRGRVRMDPLKAVADITKDVLGIKRPDRSNKDNKAPFAVKPGVTKRILQALDAKEPAKPGRSWSRWAAFQNAEARWEDMKQSRKFKYDFKLYKHIQDGVVPPRQFVSEDCAKGNAKCCAKLRDMCGNSEECRDLEYEGPLLDEDGQPIMDFDVVVLGGTLGIFYAMALQLKGLSVCVAAPRALEGQEQEWNVGMEDLQELSRLGVLTVDDINAAVTTVFDGTRAGFKNREVTPLRGGLYENKGTGFECYLQGVLNLGVSPAILIERVARRFEQMGGVIRERCPLNGVAVSPSIGCAIDLGSYDPSEDVEPITAKMVLDCMGYGSPVARQQRYGVKPDSICMVFGSCAEGYNPERNRFADAIYTFNPLQDFGSQGKHQYFWESFPVGTNLTTPRTSNKSFFDTVAFGNSGNEGPQVKSSSKTTYMFTYLDTHKRRPSLESLMDDYWKLLPTYHTSINDPETDLDIKRVLYDYFPAYRDAPMKPQFNRVLSVGEASGMQSPISFGGFRSLSRHLGRISGAVAEAVETGCLHKEDLGAINAYLPNLSAGWLFREVMSVKMNKNVKPDFTNRVLAIYLKAMHDQGPRAISPIMHDVLRFDALSSSIFLGIIADPFLMGEMLDHVGVSKMMDFMGHFANMGLYGFLDSTVSPIMELMMKRVEDPRTRFQMRRRMESWKYGSGNDYQV